MRDALLLVDVINDFKHKDGDALLESFGERQAELVCAIASARGTTPIVYANDTRGRWDGDARGFVAEVCANGRAGQRVAEIAPQAGDAFVFKPRYSAFDRAPLQILLEELEIERLLLAGMATEMCVTQTAIAARELGYKVTVLAAACATVNPESERVALAYLESVVGARIEN